ncbi:MAG: histidine triad nucleotide-binding protein [Alphaproteobacteria bacterium]|nr:histidine triad nucleotide-binding protein [Alphaproteobacteria bacterium]OJV45657.1 MAG: histidine triad nucleotide-binding protein [Alphaproteobacteria bacterium 43-37]
MPYDPNNVFAKIIRGEIPCKKVYEDEHVLGFYDIAPQAPVHVLVIPKGAYIDFNDFSQNASAREVEFFVRAVGKIARELDLPDPGYRLLTNNGANAGQEVPHFHAHICGGKPLGRMLAN